MNKVQLLFLAVLFYGCGKNSQNDQANTANVTSPLVGLVEPFEDTPGVARTTVRDGNDKTSLTGIYLNEKKESSWVEYYENTGITKTLTSYVQNKKEGVAMEFNSSNQLVKRYFYHNDQLHGEYKEYNSSVLKEERFYENGKMEGVVRIYYDDGTLLEEGYYKKGVREGISKWYDKKGNVTIQYEYKNGQLVKK